MCQENDDGLAEHMYIPTKNIIPGPRVPTSSQCARKTWMHDALYATWESLLCVDVCYERRNIFHCDFLKFVGTVL